VDAAAAIAFVDNANVIDQGSSTAIVYDQETDTPHINMNDVPGLTNATTYYTKKHEVRVSVQFTHPFVSPPTVWGRNAQSIGWRNHPDQDTRQHLQEPAGWAEVVPGSVTRQGCTLRTYVYQAFTSLGVPIGWFPVQASQVSLAWTAIGPANATGVATAESPRVLRILASPNPVGRSGGFNLTLPAASKVSLRIFRVDGTMVRELAKGRYPAGENRIAWDATGGRRERLAAGVYLYHLSTEFGDRSGKILVVR
jgi:hypothetical protein